MAFPGLLYALLLLVGATAEWDNNPWMASAVLVIGAVFAGLSLWLIRSPKAFLRVDADGIRIGKLRSVELVLWEDVVSIRSGRLLEANVLIIDRTGGSEPVMVTDVYRKPLPQILQALQRWHRSVKPLDDALTQALESTIEALSETR